MLVEKNFAEHRCPAEIVLPYHIYDPETTSLVSAVRRSRFIPALWNMDAPWMIITYGFIAVTLLLCLVCLVLYSMHFIGQKAQTVVFGFTSLLTIMAPLWYMLLVGTNFFAGYGRRWWQKLLAPTHIGITELGFKLYFRGGLFYNYPNLAVWKDISLIDLIHDDRQDVSAIKYVCKTNYALHEVILPLTGFQSPSHANIVLEHLRKHVEPEKQSPKFVELVDNNREKLLSCFQDRDRLAIEAEQ